MMQEWEKYKNSTDESKVQSLSSFSLLVTNLRSALKGVK